MRRLAATLGILMAAACGAAGADASTYEVGPGKPYAALEDVDDLLGPGDLVLVSGGQTYPGGVWLQQDGSPAQPITIRGVGSPRPVLNGGHWSISRTSRASWSARSTRPAASRATAPSS